MKPIEEIKNASELKLSPHERRALVENYTPLVKFTAYRLFGKWPTPQQLEDLISAGSVGLLEAMDAFDESMNVKFETFAKFRIRGAMIDELRRADWVPRGIRQKLKGLELLYRKLSTELSRTPSPEEMAKALELSVQEYHSLVSESQPSGMMLYEDLTFQGKGESGSLEWIPDEKSPSPDQEIYSKEMKRVVASAIEELNPSEQLVMALYYYENLTLKDISLQLEVSESRVSQIHSQALVRLNLKLEKFQKELLETVAQKSKG